jgi:hypothetical protein
MLVTFESELANNVICGGIKADGLTGLRSWFLGSLLFAFVLLFFHFGLWPTLIFEQLSTDLTLKQLSSNLASQQPHLRHNINRCVVIHVATTCDEHGVYVTKDSAEVEQLRQLLPSIDFLPNTPVDQLSFSTNSIFTNSPTDPMFIVIQTCMFGPAQRSGRSLQSPSL